MQLLLARLLFFSSLLVWLACSHIVQAAEASPSWGQLSPEQQRILSPLRADWQKFDRDSKKKWLDIAARYPAMSPEQQQILQRRMNEWVHLSPEKRRLARENFLSMGKTPLQSRREAWEAYKQLPEAERERLKQEAQHPKPHLGQVGKYLQERQKRENNQLPASVKAHASAPAAKSAAAAPPMKAVSGPLPVASSAAPCADVLRCPAR